MKAPKSELGELERAVMRIVWSHDSLSAEGIREKLDKPLKEATVRTVLRRLEDKGYVSHEVRNRTFMYSAAESRRHVAARAVKKIIDWFCDGSVDEVLVGLVDTEVIDKAQINRLLEKIDNAQPGPAKRPGRARKGAK